MWWMIPMAASMGLQGVGQYQATQAMVSGAESTAEIEKMSREYQGRVFAEGLEKQKPFYQAGKEAIPLYQQAISGEGEESGLSKMERGLVEKETSSMSDYVQGLVNKRLEAAAPEKAKGRLMDMMQIGLGQSASAGRSAINLGSSLASSLQRGGGALVNATMGENVGRQNMYMGALDQLSGLPAYMAMRPTAPQAPQRQGYVGGVNPPAPGGIMYA